MGSQELKHLRSLEFVAGLPPNQQKKSLQDLVCPHIESFNYFLKDGLKLCVQDIPPQYFELADGRHAELSILDANVGVPTVDEANLYAKNIQVYPSECRELHTTYKAKLQVTLQWKLNDVLQGSISKAIAQVPIMVKSQNCSLAKLTPKKLVECHEEAEEWGGYFIVNGNEKIIRMLIMPRRNYPMAMIRPSWKGRGPLFTEFGVSIRCIKRDQTGNTNVLHYLADGSCTLSFIYRKEQFFVPLGIMLRAFSNASDQLMYSQLVAGLEDDVFVKDAVADMLRTTHKEGLSSQKSVLKYIGERFRIKLGLPTWYTDENLAKFLIDNCVLVHLTSNTDKFNLLVFMMHKLFAVANQRCAPETPDNPMNQEILLAGHVYLIVLKDKLESWLLSLKHVLDREMRRKPETFVLSQSTILTATANALNVGNHMEHFLATGNIVSQSGLGLMQTSGYTVIADKLNFMRYVSHFRCVHRGAFFTQMRTTGVRKLLPEAWGFLCPVHTPDGAPCGLLNHLTAQAKVVNEVESAGHLPKLLISLGLEPVTCVMTSPSQPFYSVLIDGKVVGRASDAIADKMAKELRVLKALGQERVPKYTEIGFVSRTKHASQFPGLFLFTEPARMIRPVLNLSTRTTEYIGSFEQVYMDIAVSPDEIHKGVTTHMELDSSAMLSEIATLTPFSDFNQSPRNIYQCQMGKQTMGTPCQALKYRSDNKLYRIQTPQTPLVRNKTYNDYGVDNYPLGTNAVVAVISYTGYDMDDAMIINKASLERGFAHGSIYKAQVINLATFSDDRSRCCLRFGLDPHDISNAAYLDRDGLPPIGRLILEGEPLYSYYNLINNSYIVVRNKSMEPSYVDDVKALGDDLGTGEFVKVCLKLRLQRNPIIGDKFASRHGQKGTLSQKWPMENMPFSESGMLPDILFNPHGFPSRMTIGMIIESMAGKSASLHGITHDSTPFTFSEQDPAADYFGDMLIKAGYNFYGNERLYSGINGREIEASIFMGVVYYQRLRHMVADKFQVRTTGPIDVLTHQPVQGRKRQGGIRFGEMERDAMISHGSSFLLQDRLFHCSDATTGRVCTRCGSLISPVFEKQPLELHVLSVSQKRQWLCKTCGHGREIKEILVPYVFKYLVAELAAMNIRVGLEVN